MSNTPNHIIPADGWNGLKQNWRNDLVAAVSVSFVALPLSLGIAFASGVPPISGILSAVIGGVITTFFRGSHVGINGPAAGLIAVILVSLSALDDGSGRALNYLLAAIVVSGGIQALLGLLRMGNFAALFPSSVINGILAGIGIIIFGKQVHVALGTESEASHIIGVLLEIPQSIAQLNPFVTVISVVSILLLVYHARISYKLFHFLPAPMWVLVLSIPFVYGFNFLESGSLSFLGKSYPVGPEFLVDVPENLLESLVFPDFSRIGDGDFWLAVLMITLISSLITLVASKAIDKLDPYRRETDLNRELVGVGLSSAVAGMLGGLPILTVIVRSTVNVQNNAKTRWSNLYHGLILLLFIVLLAPVIQKVPLAALAAILVFAGYKLASPKVFREAYEQGIEQLLFLTGTLILTLYAGLLWGMIGGIALTLLVQVLLARTPVPTFFRMIFRSDDEMRMLDDGRHQLTVGGVANFLSMLRLKKLLDQAPPAGALTVDLSRARLVDLTVLEFLGEFGKKYEDRGGSFSVQGLAYHVASTNHPLALKSLTAPLTQTLNDRQQQLQQLALEHGWEFHAEVDWNVSYLRNFQFFETRPIEQKTNAIRGRYPELDIQWEIADITFDEGALLAREVYNTTVQIIHLPYEIPPFILEKEGIFDKVFDRVMAFSGMKDIDFRLFTRFSDKFLLKGEEESTIRRLFTPELIQFFETHEIYHVESNGSALLVFQYLRLAQVNETSRMLHFTENLLDTLGHQQRVTRLP